jgi:hypothetical protein
MYVNESLELAGNVGGRTDGADSSISHYKIKSFTL